MKFWTGLIQTLVGIISGYFIGKAMGLALHIIGGVTIYAPNLFFEKPAYGWFLILFPVAILVAIIPWAIGNFSLTAFLPRSAAISAVISACMGLYGVLVLVVCLFSGVCGRPFYL